MQQTDEEAGVRAAAPQIMDTLLGGDDDDFSRPRYYSSWA